MGPEKRRRLRARQQWPRRAFVAGALEPRLLLATISGTKFDDRDANGLRHVLLEPGLGNWTIYVDANNNGVMDATEPRAVTAANGSYSIMSVQVRPGFDLTVREVSQPGWRVTAPADGTHTVSPRAQDDTITGINFGNTQRVLVTGTVFNDTDDDGVFDRVLPREPGLQGRTVFADADNDAALDAGEASDVTDADGEFALAPPAGSYTVRQVQQAGWWQTLPSPATAGHLVTVSSAQVILNRDFGNVVATVDLFGAGFGITSAFDPVPTNGHVDVVYQIRNNGTADSPGFRADFYLSSDDNITTADTLLRSIAQGSIPRHSTADRTTGLDLPAPDPFRSDNQYYVGMIVDSDAAVVETDETNNSNRGVLADRYPVSSEADLPMPVDGANVVARHIHFGTNVGSALGDEWIGARDMDVYWFDAGEDWQFQVLIDSVAGGVEFAKTRVYRPGWSALSPTEPDGDIYDAPVAGRYHVVVASEENRTNNPRTLSGRSSGVVGNYTMVVINRTTDLYGTHLTVSGQPPAESIVRVRIGLSGRIGGPFDVNFYLSDDQTITASDLLLGSRQVTFDDYNTAVNQYVLELNSLLPGTDPLRTDNEYWLGMIIDPANALLEVSDANNSNTGDGLDRDSFYSERNLPSPVDGVSVNGSLYQPQGIGDEWIGAYDVDTYGFTARPGERLTVDFDRLEGTLDGYVRLYDAAWQLLASNDDAAAPGEVLGDDPYLSYLFPAGGSGLIVISAAGNHTSDPRRLTGRTAASTGRYNPNIVFAPAGPVSGTVFNDVDGDGTQDAGEPGLQGWTVYLDTDQSYLPQFAPRTLTDANGAFSLTARTGSYVLRQQPPAGWLQLSPAQDGGYPVSIVSDQPVGPFNFGNIRPATISGSQYNDANANGVREAGETGLAGRRMFLDLNNNGVLDNTGTFSAHSTHPPRRLPENSNDPVLSRLMVPHLPPAAVADVDVTVNATHPLDSELILQLAPAGGPQVLVMWLEFGRAVSYDDAIFDDEAPPRQLTSPLTGRYRPREALSAFDGLEPGGIWTFTALDLNGAAVAGMFNGWGLTVTLSEPYVTTDAAGNYSFTGLAPGPYVVRAELQEDWIRTTPSDGALAATAVEGANTANVDFGVRQRRLQVSGRHVFYNNGAFDGRDPAVNEADDGAIAADKSALPTGGSPSYANITSYVRGINGVMIDVHELLAPPTAADFSFKVQSLFNPGVWADGPAPTGFAVRALGGADPTARRITFTWPDGLLKNLWLQVGVLASAATRRPAPDVAYFGNLVGEAGDAATPTRVGAADVAATRGGISRARVSVQNPLDHDRDGWVNVRDVEIARSNLGRSLPPLLFPQGVAGHVAVRRADRAPPLRRATLGTGLLVETASAGAVFGS